MTTLPTTADHAVTFSEFARLAGFRRSYVTELRKAGRLALNEQGHILVEETQQRIKATADPSKAGVAARHAANREATPTTNTTETERADEMQQHIDASTHAGMSYQAARAVKERYAAMAAKRDYEFSMQQLLNAEDVRQTVLGSITTLRSRLETMPDMLAPQIAGLSDDGKIRALIAGTMQHALEEMARELTALAGDGENHG